MIGKLKISLIIIASIIFAIQDSMAQSVMGVPGYVRIPTADFNDDGTLYFGVSFLPSDYLTYTKNKYDAMAFYGSLTFLPFLEVDFRATRILNLPDNHNHTVDRMPSIRFRLIKEKKWYPSVVIGVHDFLSSINTGAARRFSASYLVCTKSFNLKKISLNLESTIGYGTDWLNSTDHEFVGFFGGISVNWERIKWINIMIEYDSKRVNIGSSFVFFNHLKLLVGLQGGDALTGTISYRISL